TLPPRRDPAVDDRHARIAHLSKPGRGHRGAHDAVAAEHHVRGADANQVVRALNRLTARKPREARNVARRVLLLGAHIHAIDTSPGSAQCVAARPPPPAPGAFFLDNSPRRAPSLPLGWG